MMFFDFNDDLGRMLQDELNGKPVPFDVWEDFLDKEAEDAPSMEECLEDMGVTAETALAKQVDLLAEWQELTAKLGVPADGGYEGCQWIGSHPINHRLRCLLLSGVYQLEPKEAQLPKILQAFMNIEVVGEILTKHQTLRQEWTALLPKLQEKTAVSLKPTAVSAYDIFNFYQELQPLSKQNKTFLHNLMTMVEQLNTVSSLRTVTPLYLYQMLKKHMKRLGKNMDLTVDLTALWSPATYAIDHDNGKNFAQYQQDLALFAGLCQLFEQDELVDLDLCGWGFASLSNLADFYHQELTAVDIPWLPIPLLDLIESVGFTCCPETPVVLHESGISTKKLMRFQCDSQYSHGLERISDYMNAHAAELTTQFLTCDTQQTKALCAKILTDSNLPPRHQPKTPETLTLHLCAINCGLQDLVDYYGREAVVKGLEG